MATSILLPSPWDRRGWKAKIRDRERVEPPHVTLLHKTRAWRWGLRERRFLDTEPDPNEVPAALVRHLGQPLVHDACVAAWNAAYPHNPVHSSDDNR